MSYFSHSQVWALEQEDRFYFGAKTNRAQVSFEREILNLIEILDSEAASEDIFEPSKSLV